MSIRLSMRLYRRDLREWFATFPLPWAGYFGRARKRRYRALLTMMNGRQFVEGYLAVMVEFLEPPEWWLRQNKEDRRVGPNGENPPGCIFGAELLSNEAAKILRDAAVEVERKRAAGWTRADFAAALVVELQSKGPL